MVLRKSLLVSTDDLFAVVREFLIPEVSRSGLDRCLRRHGAGNLRDLQAQSLRPRHKACKACEPGYLHADIKYLPRMADGKADRKTVRGTVFFAERAPLSVRGHRPVNPPGLRPHLQIQDCRQCPPVSARSGKGLPDPHPHGADRAGHWTAIGPSPMASGKAFTDRLFGLRKRSATGKHEFDQLCADHSPLSLGPMARHGSSSNTALPRRSTRKARRIRKRSGGPFPRRTA